MNVEELRASLQAEARVPHLDHSARMAGVTGHVDALHRTRRRAAVAWTAAAAALLVTAAVAVLPGQLDRTRWLDPASVPLAFSVLQERQALRPSDASMLVDDPWGDLPSPLHPGEASLAQTAFGTRFYLSPATDGQLCLLTADDAEDGTSGLQCQPEATVLGPGLFLVAWSGTTSQDPVYVAVVAPDAYTRAEVGGLEGDVVGNVAVLELSRPDERVVLTGPGVHPLSIDIGEPARSVFEDPLHLSTRRNS